MTTEACVCGARHWLYAEQAKREGSVVPRVCAVCGVEELTVFTVAEKKVVGQGSGPITLKGDAVPRYEGTAYPVMGRGRR